MRAVCPLSLRERVGVREAARTGFYRTEQGSDQTGNGRFV